MPSSAATEDDEDDGGDTSVALQVMSLMLVREDVRGILGVGFVRRGKWWEGSGLWDGAAEKRPVVVSLGAAMAMSGGAYGRKMES